MTARSLFNFVLFKKVMNRFLVLIAIALITVTGCKKEKKVYTLRIKGSESMHETFSALEADFEKLQDTIQLTIEGGGSRTGLMAIRENSVDIGLSSYPFDLDSMLGVDHGVSQLVVAHDGIVLISNENNPIHELSNEEISAIFSGKVEDWEAIGNYKGKITPIIRNENSGTQQFFSDYFDLDSPSRTALVALENREIVDKVTSDPNSIGFIGFAYFTESVNNILVQSKGDSNRSGGFVEPSFRNVNTGQYPLTRSLQIYYRTNENRAVSAFLQYLQTPRAQSVIESYGLIVDHNLAKASQAASGTTVLSGSF